MDVACIKDAWLNSDLSKDIYSAGFTFYLKGKKYKLACMLIADRQLFQRKMSNKSTRDYFLSKQDYLKVSHTPQTQQAIHMIFVLWACVINIKYPRN